jgi:DNA-binding PadR family transcriptional regulator
LIAARPSSGYDLTKTFERSLAHAWSARHSQIYPALAKLRTQGLIVQREEGPRRRKVYEITEAGLVEMRRWLIETEPERSNRNQAILRAFFLWLMSAEEAEAYLRREAEYHRQQLARFREIEESGSFLTPSTPLVLEWGIRYEEALADWAERAADAVAPKRRKRVSPKPTPARRRKTDSGPFP